MKYLFTDTPLAARRLEVLARVFHDPTDSFLQSAVDRPISLAIDLGCGPGLSTYQLHGTLRPDLTLGLDNSDAFITLARARASESATLPGNAEHPLGDSSVRFAAHDVTQIPFPSPPADLIYCRFLLAHLQNCAELAARWSTQLRPGGLLLFDEVEWIETDQPIFRRYLDIVASMLRSQGSELYIGPALDRMEVPGLTKTFSRVQRHRVSDRDAAAMFSMNIPNWKDQPTILKNHPEREIGELESKLSAIAKSASGASAIEWGLRQISFRRK